MTGSVNPCDQMDKNGWGGLMCNPLTVCRKQAVGQGTRSPPLVWDGLSRSVSLPTTPTTQSPLPPRVHLSRRVEGSRRAELGKNLLSNYHLRVATVSYLERAGTGTPAVVRRTCPTREHPHCETRVLKSKSPCLLCVLRSQTC